MKKLLLGIALLVVIAVGGLAVALMTVDVDQFRPRIQTSLSSTLGRPVSIGKMTLSLRELAFTADAIEIGDDPAFAQQPFVKADRLAGSEEHTSELQSLMRNSYAVFCLKKKTTTENKSTIR